MSSDKKRLNEKQSEEQNKKQNEKQNEEQSKKPGEKCDYLHPDQCSDKDGKESLSKTREQVEKEAQRFKPVSQ